MSEAINIVQRYWALGWNVIPLRGKLPYTRNWQKEPFDQAKLLDLLTQGTIKNIGVTTGELSGICAIDVDQPGVIGFDPTPAIKRGFLAHTTSKAPRLIFRSDDPEVLNFSRKLAVKPEELSEELQGKIIEDGDKEKITLIEILGTGRQFVAPPSTHPVTGEAYEWITPIEEKRKEDIAVINSLDELKEVLKECIREKWVIDELFGREIKKEKEDEEYLNKLLTKILDKLNGNKAGELSKWYIFRCPFHPPDNHPSFAINKEKLYAIDYHDDKVYSLKELCKALGIEVPKRKKYPAPEGWVVNRKGVFKEKYDRDGNRELVPVCYIPVRVVGRGFNIDSHEVYLKLAWEDVKGEHHEDFFPQAELYTKKGLLSLLPGRGVEVNENGARALIDYLTQSVSTFYDTLDSYTVTEKQGWKDRGFVLGATLYTRGKKEEVLLLAHTERLKGIHAKGTLEGWYDAAEGLLKHDRARFKVYASCSAPLLRLLDVKSYIIDDYGETSTGKTTTLELAVSVWGNPYQLELTANATKVGLERLAASFCDLPLFLDETSLIDRKILQELVYMLANETGRVRGRKTGGLQETESWKTVVFATGEAPIKGASSFGGLSGRVIELYGGLGADDLEAIEKFKDNITDHYGVIGPLLIEKLLSYSRDDLVKTFRKLRAELRRKVKGRLEARLSNTFAAIICGGALFEEILEDHGLPIRDPLKVVLGVYNETVQDLSDAGYLERFLSHLRGWIAANRTLFFEDVAYPEDDEKPNWHERYGRIGDDYVDIFPHILKKTIESFGFNYDRVLKDLKENGIIKANVGRQYNTRINGERVTVVRFLKNKLFEEVGE